MPKGRTISRSSGRPFRELEDLYPGISGFIDQPKRFSRTERALIRAMPASNAVEFLCIYMGWQVPPGKNPNDLAAELDRRLRDK